jgi:hypothetical protein
MLMLDRSNTPTAQHFRVLVRVDQGDKWFAELLRGTFEFATSKTRLEGKVAYGNWLQCAKVEEEGQLVGTNPLRFTGTMTLTTGRDRDDD